MAISLFLGGWLVMVAAMMLPASLPTIRQIEGVAAAFTRPRRVPASFLVAFAAVWALFGLAAFLGDMVVHHVVDTTPWLGERPYLIEAAILALAGLYQFAPLKRRTLGECRDPGALVSAAALARGAARLGLRHGLACLGTSWALMLVMFGEGFGGLGWMVVLTAVMVDETTGRRGHRTATVAGIVLLIAALSVLSSGTAHSAAAGSTRGAGMGSAPLAASATMGA
ncbi:MAG TPA: DUF2182 domain-containing protein [Candidatus Limnocylindrales bacterium]|nr:DUF2182 domain-containing protein [Candidatus Limnocylindrales bacterium]